MTAGQENLWTCRNVFGRRFDPLLRAPRVRAVLGFLAFETAYYFAYRYGMSFSQASASPFWFPDSVLLCALLWSPPGRWWLLVLGTLPIRLFSEVAEGIPIWFLLATSGIDAVKGVAAASILRRLMTNPLRFDSVRDFALFSGFAVLLIPAVSALGGAAAKPSATSSGRRGRSGSWAMPWLSWL